MKLRIQVESAGRRGKQVTVIRDIKHNPTVIENLAKKIKQKLGAGGAVKGKTIEIQGDHVNKIKEILTEEGFTF